MMKFQNKWAIIITFFCVVCVVGIGAVRLITQAQPNAYKQLLDDTLDIAQEKVSKVAYELSTKNGHHIVMYVPVDENNQPDNTLYSAIKMIQEAQENATVQQDAVQVIYVEKENAIKNVDIYQIYKDEYVYKQGKYYKNTGLLVRTVCIKDGQELMLQQLIDTQVFDTQSLVDMVKTTLKSGNLPSEIKVRLEKELSKETVGQSRFVYTSDEMALILSLSGDVQSYYISINPEGVVPYFNKDYIYATYQTKYESILSTVQEQSTQIQNNTGNELIDAIHNRQENKRIAITFDDGPRRDQTTRVLDILKKHDIKATFYILGSNISGNEDILKRQVAEGHELGSHSWTHPDLTTVSQEQLEQELNRTYQTIKEVSGVEPKSLRPPYGAFNKAVAQVANLPIVNWDVDSKDWKNRNVAQNVDTVLRNTSGGSIILMHDIHPESVDSVDTIITQLKQKGYEFVRVSELIGQEYFVPNVIYFSYNDARQITE